MAEALREEVGHCPNPKCAKPVLSDHADPWCHKCGERFPEAFVERLPRLTASRTVKYQPAAVIDQPDGSSLKQAGIAASIVGVLLFLLGLVRFNSMESQVIRGLGGSDGLSVFLLLIGGLLAVGGSFLAFTQTSSAPTGMKHPPTATTVCDNCRKSFPSPFYLERVNDGQYFCEQCRKEVARTVQKEVASEASTGVVQSVAVTAPASAMQSIEQRLDRLKTLFENNAINEQEYRERRSKLLDEV